ncbi:MAG: HAMP domain-containing protein, partial [Comamonadaceae bacterium]
LLVAAGVETDEALGPARDQALRSLATAVVVLLLTVLLLALIVRRISSPMRALARTAEAVAAGDAARRAPEAGPLEVARVAVEFNRMLDRLPALEQAVRESEERHRTLLQKLSRHIPGTLFQLCMAPDGRLWMPFASEAIERMFATTPQQAQADAMVALRRIHPDDLPGVLEGLYGSARLLTYQVLRYRVELPSQGLRYYLTYAHPEEEDGSVLWHGCTVDVTSLEEARLALRHSNETLEARVAERTRALAAANDSLESFSYSVAHDLRAPLAAIEGFTEALPMVLERGDGVRLTRLTDRIAANTRQMGGMIDGLLEVARAGKGELQEAPVPQERMVEGVLAELAPPASIRVEVGPLPVVRADAATLRQVWWNLLANAAKFTAHRPAGRIEIRC